MENFVHYQWKWEKSLGLPLKELQNDWGGENVGDKFKQYREEDGIQHRKSVRGTPEQNEVDERMNVTLKNVVRCLLIQSGAARR